MAKKPQSISILGEQLLGEARQRNTDRENKQIANSNTHIKHKIVIQ